MGKATTTGTVWDAMGVRAPWQPRQAVQPTAGAVARPGGPVGPVQQPRQPQAPRSPLGPAQSQPPHVEPIAEWVADTEASLVMSGPKLVPGGPVRRIVCHCQDCDGLGIYTTAPAATPNATHRLIQDTHYPNSEHAILGAAQRAAWQCTPLGTAAARQMKERMPRRRKPSAP